MTYILKDFPGRTAERSGTAAWRVGIPPSGPMDSLALRCANRLVGNSDNDAGLEFTVKGPTIRFNENCMFAICGANFECNLDGMEVALWKPHFARSSSTLSIGMVKKGSAGIRGYISFSGGLDLPLFLGSRSTLPLGNMGGFQGRILRENDSIPIFRCNTREKLTVRENVVVPESLTSLYKGSEILKIRVLPGPQEAPDFITELDKQLFYSTAWKVNYNSNRLGIRFEGPRFQWSRTNGGAGGSHPSNVPDNEYAIGTINMTGDMPIAITVDGPSLGGFVCVATAPMCELFKFGQLRPGKCRNAFVTF